MHEARRPAVPSIDHALVAAVDAASAQLARNAPLRSHFAGELEWLAARRRLWTGRVWRVGLIGITSAGKSTLLNALLGDAVLPERVRPSSNCLVVCRRGRARAVVRYDDGRVEELRGRRRVRERLAALADETTNPGNRAGVEEIGLFWPGFGCGDDVAVVDTPGLDAYGLERHEDVTLRLFLPTVDLVVFVTTAKANADGTIRRYLDTIADHGKPLVLVQNAIDSVEPKLGADACVARTPEEVGQDHLRRLRRLVDRVGGDARSAAIVQTSALRARAGDLDGSNVPALVGCVADRLASLVPRLWGGRVRQLRAKLDEAVAGEEARLAGGGDDGGRALAADDALLAATQEDLKALDQQLRDAVRALGERVAADHGRFRAVARSLSPSDAARAEGLRRELDAARSVHAGALGRALAASQERVRASAQRLLLSEEDYALHPLPARQRRSVRIPTTVEHGPPQRTTKRSGFFAWVGRAFGADWGWNMERPSWMVLDVAGFRRDLQRALDDDAAWLADLAERVARDGREKAARLGAELGRALAAVERRRCSVAQAADRRAVVAALRTIAAGLPPVPPAEPRVAAMDRPARWAPPVPLEVPRLTVDLVRLASLVARRRFAVLRTALLERAERRRPGAAREAVVWSWDGDSLDRFVARFWPEVAAPGGPAALVRQTRAAAGLDRLLLVAAPDQPDEAQRAALRGALDAVEARPGTLFLLVDAEQPGSTASRLGASVLRGIGACQIPVVLVVQSLRGLRNAGALVPGLGELRRLGATFQLPVVGVLANDDDTTLSCLLDTLYRRGDELRGIRDEERWIADLGGNDVGARNTVGEILRQWRQTGGGAREPDAAPTR